MSGAPEAFTIGHSTHEVGRFLELLTGHGVETVADVRRFPGSRRNPQFGAPALRSSLNLEGISYEALGVELGGRRSALPDSPNGGWRVMAFRAYADHMASAEFASGVGRLEAMARERLTAVMCAEADFRRCHRCLIADALLARGWRVRHILPGGGLQEHELTAFAVLSGGRVHYPPANPQLGRELDSRPA